ncbi:autotransporter-associated beta strand repeat-containing protein [Roseateles sp.]|uniref:autotransporter-associated beta strand repeat-containing protein n=1 Tax=Roseateles sp. TaxID=1971397 RepID=UPI002E078063|nr:autotransporter-associated beta strand repeat-containing protein [Roseateles sp.]
MAATLVLPVSSAGAAAICGTPSVQDPNFASGTTYWSIPAPWFTNSTTHSVQMNSAFGATWSPYVSQTVTNVAPSPVIQFVAGYDTGQGNAQMELSYGGVVYATWGAESAWSLQNGATCIQNCSGIVTGPSLNGTLFHGYTVMIQLPASAPSTGLLAFRFTGGDDDMSVGSVSMTQAPTLCLSESLSGSVSGTVGLSGSSNVDFNVDTTAANTTATTPTIAANGTSQFDASATQPGTQAIGISPDNNPVTITQTSLPAGYVPGSVSCAMADGTVLSPTVSLTGSGAFTLPSSVFNPVTSGVDGPSASCTFTNSLGTYWDTLLNNGAVDGGIGFWDGSTSNWTGSAGASNTTWAGGTSTAIFNGTAGTVTIASGYNASVGGLSFGTDGYVIDRTGTGTLALAQSSTVATSASGLSATIAAPITGSFALTFTPTASGTLTLSGTNTYTGLTTISTGGKLVAASAAALGGIATGTTVSSGGTLAYSGGLTFNAEPLTLNGSGASGSAGALDNASGSNSMAGAVTLASAATIGASAGSLSLSGAITGGFGLTFAPASGATIAGSGAIGTGANTLTHNGAGTTTLSGANTYTGATLISAGKLVAASATALGTTAGGASVTSGATLALQGGITVGAEALTLNGTGLGGVGALENLSGSNTYGGAITQASASTIGATAGSLSLSGAISGGFGLTFVPASGAAITASGVIGTGANTLTHSGAGTTTLSAANTYSGATNVNAGTLVIGAANGVPAASVVTVASGATLSVGNFAQSRTAAMTVNGTLNLGGASSNLTLSGANTVAAITGTGTVTVPTGATLTLTGPISDANLTLVMAGGTLNLGNFTHSIGTLSQTAASSVVFTSSSSLTVATLTPSTFAMSATGWTAGSSHFYATAVTGSPARDTANVAPLNKVALGGNAASLTYWASGSPGELLVASGVGTYWDATIGNGTVDGGTGTWDGTTANWTPSNGTPNGTWAGGTNTATFQGTAGTVTVSGTQSIGGLTFNTTGYTLSGGTLSLAAASNVVTNAVSGGTALIGAAISGPSGNDIVFDGPGTTTLSSSSLSYAGNTTVNAGTLVFAGAATGAPFGTATANWTLGSGATLRFSNTDRGDLRAANVTLNDTSTIDFNGATANGGTTIWSNSSFIVPAGSAATLKSTSGNGLNTSTAALTFNVGAGGTLTDSAQLWNGGSLTKTGSGLMVISVPSTHPNAQYSGATTISAGTLQIGDGGANGDINGTSAVTVNSPGTLSFKRSDVISFGKAIGGTGSVAQDGTGTTTLMAASTYSGATNVNVGTLKAGVATSAFGSGSAVTVASLSTLDLAGFSETIGSLAGAGGVSSSAAGSSVLTTGNTTSTLFSGVISNGSGGGTVALTKQGSGTFTLSGANTYTGATTVSAGTLQAGAANSFSSGSAVTLSAATSVLDLAGFSQAIGSLASAVASSVTSSAAGSATLTTGGNGTTTAFAGVIGNGSGTVGLAKVGAGVQTLSGANTYSGATTVSAGTLKAGVATQAFGINSAVTVASGATLDLAGFSQAIGSLAGAGTVDNATGASAYTLATGGDNTSTLFSGIIKNTTGSVALTKSGAGTLTLSGPNTYTGATTVNAGTLLVNGNQPSATGAVAVAGGTLGGSGTVGGATTVQSGATLSPGPAFGTGAGTLSLKAGLTVNAGATTAFELGQAGTAGGSLNDLVAVTGNLSLNGTLNVTQSSGGSFTGGTYTLFTYTGTRTGTFSAVNLPAGYAGSVDYTGTPNQVRLTVTALSSTTYWDVSPQNNNAVDGGTGTWDGSNTNWTTGTGSLNSTWPGGTSMAIFNGTAGTVTIANGYNASVGGLSFGTGGYTIAATGTGSLALAQNATIATTTAGLSTTLSAPLTGAFDLTYTPNTSGTLTLSGTNAYTGNTSISAGGSLQVGGAGSLGAGSYAGTIGIATGATLQYSSSADQVLSGQLSGSGSLVKDTGTSTLTLSATNNPYTGNTTVLAGTLFGTTSADLCVASGVFGDGVLTIGPGATVKASGTNVLGCRVAYASGTSSVVINGGTFTLDATQTANMPAITLNGGTLATYNSVSGLGADYGTYTPRFGISVTANSTLSAENFVNYTTDSSGNCTASGIPYTVGSGVTLSVTGYFGFGTSLPDCGFTLAGGGSIVLTNNGNNYVGPTFVSAGTLSIGNGGATGAITGTSGVTLQAAGVLSFNRNNAYTFGTLIGGAGVVKQIGAGTTTLTAANNYTGGTTVTAGTLLVNGNQSGATGAATVAAAATLGGTGTLGGSVTVSGTLSPGAGGAGSFGTGALTLNSGATFAAELGASGTTGGGVNDLVQVTGDLKLDGALQVTALSGFNTSGTYTLITYTGTRTGTFSSDNLAAIGYQGVIEYNDTLKQVNLVSVPRLRIAELTTGGTGSFDFALTGLGSSSLTLATSTAGVGVTSAALSGTISTAASITQTPPSGWAGSLASATCVDANGASNGNGTGSLGSLSGSTVTLSAAALRAGADITCTFTNARNGLSGVVFNDGGASGGTANDGLQNGGEAGLANVTVSLTNCAGTAYASTTTDGSGAYALAIPAAQAGQNVCVAATLPAGYLATGANAAGTALPSGSATSVGGTSFTYSRSANQVAFAAPASGAAVLGFGLVPVSTLVQPSVRQVTAGASAVHAHVFTAGTAGSLQVQLGTASSSSGTPGWNEVAYLDAGCTGTVQSGATRLYPSGSAVTVTQNQAVCFVVQDFAPAVAPSGSSNSVPVSATLTFTNASPTLSATYSLSDTTTVSAGVVSLSKLVRNVTKGESFTTANQAKPGDVLEYQITYTNLSPQPITNLTVADYVSPYAGFVSASEGTTPAGLTSCLKNTPANPLPAAGVACSASQAAGGSGAVGWTFAGQLNPGASGTVLFRITVN